MNLNTIHTKKLYYYQHKLHLHEQCLRKSTKSKIKNQTLDRNRKLQLKF